MVLLVLPVFMVVDVLLVPDVEPVLMVLFVVPVFDVPNVLLLLVPEVVPLLL